ncbi:MAG: hypothetical protein ACUVRY_09845 [Thermoanaerobaculaceae bacterium]
MGHEGGRSWLFFAAVAVVPVAVLWLYEPVLHFQLMGDDYQWVQHAHRAAHRPILLLTDLDTFYRPANTWTLVLDRWLWGQWPSGFHLTNLLWQALAAVLLAFLARRLGLPSLAAAILGLIWATAPFTLEPAASVAIRFENLLFCGWLGLLLLWPRKLQAWTWPRRVGVALATLWCLAAKETWVITPALVALWLWAKETTPGIKVLKPVIPSAVLAGLYFVAYFFAFPGDKGYFRWEASVLAKIPQQLAAFFYLEPLMPAGFSFRITGAVALAMTVFFATYATKEKIPAGVFALGLLFFPALPTLFVPYLPTRYTSVPYAGFLLLLFSCVQHFGKRLPRFFQVGSGAVLALLGVVVLTAAWSIVRADLRDLARVSAAHEHLLEQASKVAAGLPLDRPVLLLRQENRNPLWEIASTPQGWPKLFYVRHSDPDGLIDAPALFEWVLGREAITFTKGEDLLSRLASQEGAVLVHHHSGFSWASFHQPRVGEAYQRWIANGGRARLFYAQPLP